MRTAVKQQQQQQAELALPSFNEFGDPFVKDQETDAALSPATLAALEQPPATPVKAAQPQAQGFKLDATRTKYYRSLQSMASKAQQRVNTSPKSEPRQSRTILPTAATEDKPERRLSHPINARSRSGELPSSTVQQLRSSPMAIPVQAVKPSAHRFRSAQHPRVVCDSSASFLLPAHSYLPSAARQCWVPQMTTESEDEREQLRKRGAAEDAALSAHNSDTASSDEDQDDFFEMEL